MIDARTQMNLQELFRRENRSFLQYIRQASPWVKYGDQVLIDKVNRLADEEKDALQRFADWLDSQRIALPYLGAFPTSFTHYNFVDIRKLIKPLVAEQRKELAQLEADARAASSDASKKYLDTLVELNRKHLADFEQMTQPHPV